MWVGERARARARDLLLACGLSPSNLACVAYWRIGYCVACTAYSRIGVLRMASLQSLRCSIPSCSGFDEVRTMGSGGWGGVGEGLQFIMCWLGLSLIPQFFGHSSV